jgi:hypothetical protein
MIERIAAVHRFRCRRCGVRNPADMKYCGQCSAPLVPPCPCCKFQNSPQSRFCGQCAVPMPISPDSSPPREMTWATGAFIALSIIVLLGAGALYSSSLGGRFSTKLGLAAMLSATVAPGFIALLLATAERGSNGIKRLLSPMLIWRVNVFIYLAAIAVPTLGSLFAIELSVIQSYLFGGSRPSLPPMWAFWYVYETLRISLFLFWLIFFHMTGWFGYALPRLQRTHEALTSALILGAGLVILTQASELIGLPSMYMQTAWLIPGLLGGAVWLAWIYNSTNGSLLLTTLTATTLNANGVLLFHFQGREMENAIVGDVLTAIMLIAIYGRTSLSMNNTRVKW